MDSLLRSYLLALPRSLKRITVLLLDGLFCALAVYFAFCLRLEEWVPISSAVLIALALSFLIASPIFITQGLYRAIFRYSGGSAIWTIIKSVLIYSVFYFPAILLASEYLPVSIPRSVGIVQPILLLLLVGSSRAWANFWLGDAYKKIVSGKNRGANIFIYGAGSAGRQLAQEISRQQSLKVVGFIDDSQVKGLKGTQIDGIPVLLPDNLKESIHSSYVQEIWLALPSVNGLRRKQIINSLVGLGVAVRTLPTLHELASGQVSISDVRDLDINDLLNREVVPPQSLLLAKNINERIVLITGAAGSIGSELSRQALDQSPTKLILLDRNEFGLYSLQQELLERKIQLGPRASAVQIISILGSVADAQLMFELLSQHSVHIIFHAAAYKHVPLVEHNLKEGLRNNVFGTLTIVKAAAKYGVPHFILVSTDKAVRPTNVMGASKRLCEKILQAFGELGTKTQFSMVRFGNVLGSSGSVVPIFRKQIAQGGPITVTHPEITRYFMSISEAAQLVIQAGSMAEGGEVFLLDMGNSVKINDLAIRMVELSGLKLKDESHPFGDIEIEYTGLRPGEKLYEELLIGDNPQATTHPKIFKATESALKWEQLEEGLGLLENLLDGGDIMAIRAYLQKLVVGYIPDSRIVDWSYELTAQTPEGGGRKA